MNLNGGLTLNSIWLSLIKNLLAEHTDLHINLSLHNRCIFTHLITPHTLLLTPLYLYACSLAFHTVVLSADRGFLAEMSLMFQLTAMCVMLKKDTQLHKNCYGHTEVTESRTLLFFLNILNASKNIVLQESIRTVLKP